MTVTTDVKTTDDTVYRPLHHQEPADRVPRPRSRSRPSPSSASPTWSSSRSRTPRPATASRSTRRHERLAEVPAVVRTLPAQVKDLRGEVETRVATAQEQADDLYAQLAVRGERLVTAIRRQPATEAAIAEGKEAVKKAEAATTAAKKSAKAGEKAVEDAAKKLG